MVILQAVKALIEEKGIAQLKITEISKLANTSTGSIYQYFSDKDTLIYSLAEYFTEQIHAIIDKNLQQLQRFEDIETVFKNNFDDIYQLHQNEPALREIWFESINPALSELAAKDCQINADKIYQRVLQLSEPENKAQFKCFTLLLVTQFSAMMRLCLVNNQGTPEQYRDMFADMVVTCSSKYMKPW